ncbi:hypothetical protein THRCLA_03016 [Thraustotheca clavata]|uniref:Uncharacterized protein n=1 Tax=Thraustotheca clavata TaxID=74557 RepID=A0A1W0A3B0_9STRA|nr:hypothetical protein THRCLA_03016 [Thraustotheca clavata]
MWQKYYRHYYDLAINLRLLGIEDAKPTDRIEIVVGDPTSIILLNPYVSIAFILDIWVSIEFFIHALSRVTQFYEIKLCLLACFYLSRMLWLAYGALILLSYILKKIHYEKSFSEADPTLTAIIVSIITGPITNLNSRTIFFIDLYYHLFLSFAKDENSSDGAIPVVVFCFTIGMLPIVAGFLLKCPNCPHKRNGAIPYGSITMNDIKHRFTHYFNFMTFSDTASIVKGGGMYQLFAHNRKYKRNLVMSQRGEDCYVVFGLGKQRTSVRLSLLSCIDLTFSICSMTDSTAAVGRLYFDKDEVKLLGGAYNSPWIT